MHYLYTFLTYISIGILHIVSLFDPKIKLFVKGRKQSFRTLHRQIDSTHTYIWMHVASLGEYEQGLPVMEQIRKEFPRLKIVLTFFSPSGYEVKKESSFADITLYLPMDTPRNVRKFLRMVQPKMAFFVKYEYWPNYLYYLKKHRTPTYLISGIFRPKQIFFKPYGHFYRRTLMSFSHFFVQNDDSRKLLHQIGFDNVTVAGDTRFDRVSKILEQDNQLDFLDEFTKNKSIRTVVIGSSWPEDEAYLSQYINQSKTETKFIFAPHNIREELISNLVKRIQKKVIRYTEIQNKSLADFDVLIIDAYSLLTKTYSYGAIGYVGGGFGSGIHNILEAATFGIPVLIGPNFQKFQEAKDLIALKGCFVVNNQEQLNKTLDSFLLQDSLRIKAGRICQNYILSQKNASQKIIHHLRENEL